MGRKRKVDLDKLSINELDDLSVQIGDRVRSILDKTSNRVNKILKTYNMSAKIAIAFDELPESMEGRLTDGTLVLEEGPSEQS